MLISNKEGEKKNTLVTFKANTEKARHLKAYLSMTPHHVDDREFSEVSNTVCDSLTGL